MVTLYSFGSGLFGRVAFVRDADWNFLPKYNNAVHIEGCGFVFCVRNSLRLGHLHVRTVAILHNIRVSRGGRDEAVSLDSSISRTVQCLAELGSMIERKEMKTKWLLRMGR